MDKFSGISAFVHAAEQLSFVAAGRLLGISASAAAKSVARLEEHLGVRLLHRTTRRIGLTEEGAVYLQHCRRILDEMAEAGAVMAESAEVPRGRLRLSVPHVFGHYLLLPELPAFRQRFPDIQLDIDFEDQVVDIVGAGLDAAVRSGDLVDTRLMARRLGAQHFVICGSPSYLEAAGVPSRPEELARHHLIHFKYPSSGRLAPWALTDGEAMPPLPQNLVFNNTDAGLAAAVAGLGLAHLPVYVARAKIEAGELLPVLAGSMRPFGALSIVWPSSRQLSPKIRAFVTFIVEAMRRRPNAFSACRE